MKNGDFKVITLCGSTRFPEEYAQATAYLTLKEEACVFSVAIMSHQTQITSYEKVLLDKIHKNKILASDEIFVVDVDQYVGSSTASEIRFATAAGVTVRYLSKEFPNGFSI